MGKLAKLLGHRKVIFIKTEVSGIDRGWNPSDVALLLRSHGVHTETASLGSADELESTVENNIGAIFWPVCYSLAHDPHQDLLAKQLTDLNVNYVGASPKALAFSSKINFIEKAASISELNTPAFKLLCDGRPPRLPTEFSFPFMLKTEYSCNSEGVRRIDNSTEFVAAHKELKDLYGQRHYVEKWERFLEYTVAYIPATSSMQERISPLRLVVLSDSSFIDIETKARSSLVRVEELDDDESKEVEQLVRLTVGGLKIDGHCRIDLIRNEDKKLFVIELNFQPFLSFEEKTRSYFPNALLKTEKLDFHDQVFQILEHSMNRSGRLS